MEFRGSKYVTIQLYMTVGDFLDNKIQNDHSKIPEFRYFDE
jgi:hypothetical protein